MKKKAKKLEKIAIALFVIIVAICGYFNNYEEEQIDNNIESNKISYELSNIPAYNGQAYVEINDNIPKFTDEDMNLQEDYYSTLKNKKVRNGYDKN